MYYKYRLKFYKKSNYQDILNEMCWKIMKIYNL